MVIQIPKCSKRKRININALYVKDFSWLNNGAGFAR